MIGVADLAMHHRRATAGEVMGYTIRLLRAAVAKVGALETALIFVELQYFLMVLIIPREWQFIVAFMDIDAANWVLALPFAVAFVASFCGLILNEADAPSAKWVRIFGATVGMAVWFFILVKNLMVGLVAASINPWMLMAIVASLWIIRCARRGTIRYPRA